MGEVSSGTVCAVAVAKGEDRFIREWLAYHRLIGVDHFIVYDNDPALPLRPLLHAEADFVTVIDWPRDPAPELPGKNRQMKAYLHALERIGSSFEWVTFIDVDEFIVLRQHESLPDFLSSFERFGSVRLNWHVFGHNGHYNDPAGLITSALTRRMWAPSPQTKTIARPEAVASMVSAHRCELQKGWATADANGQEFTSHVYAGKTRVAHINHYQCRSFRSWMSRVDRGDISFDRSDVPPEHAWRLDEELCLRQFVETVAKDKNEIVDDYMTRYADAILEQLR